MKIFPLQIFKKSEFIKNVLSLFSGAALSQLILLMAEPILTRIYTPEDFGVLALFMSVTLMFSIVATGRYELAVMLPHDEKKAINIVALSVIITIAVSLFSLLIILLFNHQICHLLKNNKVSPYLYLVPVSVFIAGLFQSFNYWASRQKRFLQVASSRISQSSGTSGMSILLGFKKIAFSGLVIGQITGQLFSLIPVINGFIKKDRIALKHINKKDIKEVAKIYSEFPKINSLHAFTDILQLTGVSFLISYFFSEMILGFYSRTFRILQVPASFIGGSISQVFFQKASIIYNDRGDLKQAVKKVLFSLSLISIPIFTLIMIFGPEIFSFVLGKNWRIAGEYARILSPWICLNFIISPVSQIPLIVNKQKQVLLFSLLGNGIILFSIFYGGFFAHNIKSGLILLSSLMVLYYIVLSFWIIKIAGIKKTKEY